MIHSFAEWAAKSDFSADMEDWMNDNCDDFEKATAEGEQDLKWGKLHHEFVDMLENKISEFCKGEEISEKIFFSNMERSLDSGEDSSMFPVFLLNVEYNNFLIEMRSRANKRRTERLAQKAARDHKGDEETNFSGIWDPIPEKTSEDEIDEFMAILKIPWYVRGPWKRSMKSAMNYTIHHKPGEYLELTRAARFYGVRTTRYPFDEVLRGKDVEADASYTFERGDAILTDVARGKCPGKIKKRFGPPGSGWEKIWKFGKTRNELIRVRKIILKDGTAASFHTYYRRRGGSGK